MKDVAVKLKPSEEKPWLKLWEDMCPDASGLDCLVYEYLKKKNADYLDDIALVYFDRKITYREFFENVENTAKAYKKLGVKAGDIITVCSVMTPETIYSFYALDTLGVTLNMTDPRTSAMGLREYIEEVGSTVVLSLSVAYEKIKEAVEGTKVETVIVVSPSDSLPAGKKFAYNLFSGDKNTFASNVIRWNDFIRSAENDAPVAPVEYDENRAILIMHTGGTTGTPKGVLLSDKNLNALAVQYVAGRIKGRQEKMLNIMPPFIAYGYGVGVHTPLCFGAQVILIPKFDPNDFGKLMKKYHPNHTAGVPLHYQILVGDKRVQNMDLSFLKSTGCGGDSIATADEDVVNEFFLTHNAPYKLSKGYGMTECSACATACIKDIFRRGSVGVPMFLTTVGVFKPDTDEELGYNEEGEICFNTPTTMLGYYHMDEETKNVVRRHSDGKLWVHSGDIGRMDEDGFVFVINRIKRVIIRHDGFKVFPYIIENKIISVDGVANACAVGVTDKDHAQGKLPYVYLTVENSFNGDREELKKKVIEVCERDLPEYILPAGYEFIEEMPHTPIGKVDYMALQNKAKDLVI